MPNITKKKTNELKHYAARTISNIQVVTDENEVDTPYISFIGGKGGYRGASETVMKMTPEAWSRAAMGTGTAEASLRDGLDRASRYRFVLLADDVMLKGSDEPEEVIVGVHCIPDDNYIMCDFGATLNRPNITENTAVVHLHDKSGEVDIIAFPGALRKGVDSFLKELEKIDSFDNTTTFTASGITYSVVNAFGTELTFRCSKHRA